MLLAGFRIHTLKGSCWLKQQENLSTANRLSYIPWKQNLLWYLKQFGNEAPADFFTGPAQHMICKYSEPPMLSRDTTLLTAINWVPFMSLEAPLRQFYLPRLKAHATD